MAIKNLGSYCSSTNNTVRSRVRVAPPGHWVYDKMVVLRQDLQRFLLQNYLDTRLEASDAPQWRKHAWAVITKAAIYSIGDVDTTHLLTSTAK